MTNLPDFKNAGQLEHALVSFGECVEETFPIVMRFRADPFLGLSTEVASQRKEDGELVDSVVAACKGRMDLDRRLSVYRREHPVSPADRRELVDNFVSCAGKISADTFERVSEANLDTLDSVTRFVSDLSPQNAGLPGDHLVAISDCMAEITGPEHVFSEGHPWFTP